LRTPGFGFIAVRSPTPLVEGVIEDQIAERIGPQVRGHSVPAASITDGDGGGRSWPRPPHLVRGVLADAAGA
jgi:hypothetical protein